MVSDEIERQQEKGEKRHVKRKRTMAGEEGERKREG